MESLVDVIADDARRPRVVSDIVGLVDTEVSRKGGISGVALKGGYKVVKSLKGGQMIPDVVDGLLEEFVGALEPVHAEYRASGGTGGFGAYLKRHERSAVDALLKVTDVRAQRTSHAVIRKTYDKLRPMAEKHVAEALPGVGAVVDRHCA